MAEAKNGKERITIIEAHVTNFHRITAAEVKFVPGRGLVRVTGKNRAGKSTVLDAISSTLAGAGAVRPMPRRLGTEEGEQSLTRLLLSNGFTLSRRYTDANPKGHLTVAGPDGGRHGQRILDGWAGPLSFDPLAFFSLKQERQTEIVLSLGSDPELPTKLADLRKERAEKYAERTPRISAKRKAAQEKKPAGERPEPVDVSFEMRRLGELQQVERDRDDLIRGTERQREEAERKAQQDIRDAAAAAEQVDRGLAEAVRDADSAERKVAQLREELAEAERDEIQLRALVKSITDTYQNARAVVDRLTSPELAASAIPDPELPPDPFEEMGEVRDRLEASSVVDAAIEPWRAWDRSREELEQATLDVDALTNTMGQLELQEKKLVRSAGIPLPGVTFADDGSLLLNDLPLQLASGAEKIELAVRVAIAVDPELGIVLVDEANDIDLDGIEKLDALAT